MKPLWTTIALGLLSGSALAAPSIPDPSIEPAITALFDMPARIAKKILPAADNAPNPAGVVRCFYYPTFTVKELDNGEHGDDAISVKPFAANAKRPDCGKQDDPGEKVVKGGQGSYFVGAKGEIVYLMSTLGGDATPFSLVDARSDRVTYTDQTLGSGPSALALNGDVLTLTYRHGAPGSCSILAGGEACWKTLAREAKLPREIAATTAPIGKCKTGYGKTDASASSIIGYQVTIAVELSGHAKSCREGRSAVRPSSRKGAAATNYEVMHRQLPNLADGVFRDMPCKASTSASAASMHSPCCFPLGRNF